MKHQEIEDVVIYLSSLGKQHEITVESLAITYKQWSLAQLRRSTPPTTYKGASFCRPGLHVPSMWSEAFLLLIYMLWIKS